MPSKTINASIITIGDELLIGQTIDTNSAFIAQQLNSIGIWVKRRVAVGDVYEEIWKALDEEGKVSDLVIITGGLGPTADDITKPLLCDYFGGKLVVNEDVLAHVKYLFEVVFRRPGPLLERNLKQAEVPDNCIVLPNKRGTAPGMWFSRSTSPDPSHLTSPSPSKGGEIKDIKPLYYATSDKAAYSILKKFAKEQKDNPTKAEELLWKKLKGKELGGYKFRRQHIIRTFIADFICIPEKLIIEVDGSIHQIPENKLSDVAREMELNIAGYRVIRFTNMEILSDAENVASKILDALKKRNAVEKLPKNPPLEGREADNEMQGGQTEMLNPPLEGRETKRNVVFISLPGVPHEMKGLMTDEVIPRLLNTFDVPAIVHRTAFTAGLGESMIAELLKDFEPALPSHIKLAYLPNYGMVRLRLTAQAANKEAGEKEIAPYFEKMQELVKDFLVTNTDEGLEIVIGKILKKKGKTMGTAESCTGGYIAHLITSVAGSSAYYNGSVVSYSNNIKENLLHVDHETLMGKGAVSEETVREMVKGALIALKTDYVLATSGIMGPGGGTEAKPVGTVWIAVGNKDDIETMQLHLRFDRERNINMTAYNALNFLRKFVLRH